MFPLCPHHAQSRVRNRTQNTRVRDLLVRRPGPPEQHRPRVGPRPAPPPVAPQGAARGVVRTQSAGQRRFPSSSLCSAAAATHSGCDL